LDDRLANQGTTGNYMLQSLAWRELGKGLINKEFDAINLKANEGNDHRYTIVGKHTS